MRKPSRNKKDPFEGKYIGKTVPGLRLEINTMPDYIIIVKEMSLPEQLGSDFGSFNPYFSTSLDSGPAGLVDFWPKRERKKGKEK